MGSLMKVRGFLPSFLLIFFMLLPFLSDRPFGSGKLNLPSAPTSNLARLVPIEQFSEADYFLFLRSELQPATQPTTIVWIPWSALYLKPPPRYILGAERIKYAQQLLRPLGVEDIDTLRVRLRERVGKLAGAWGDGGRWHYPLSGFHFNTIGSRQ